MAKGTLYVVATPIGNLKDITLRALEVLKAVDLILCEDTRVTRTLLDHYDLKTPTSSYHQHSPEAKVREIINLLEQGKNLALVTDAGTPGISDPGGKLIESIVRFAPPPPQRRGSGRSPSAAAEGAGGGLAQPIDSQTSPHPLLCEGEGTAIVPIPGPSAVIAALSISGFSTDKFIFMGFPPHKKKRQKFFKEVAESKYTIVFYESSHRIKKCLSELKKILPPDRKIVVCRELTKKFESVYRGTIAEVEEIEIPAKGEFVVIVKSE